MRGAFLDAVASRAVLSDGGMGTMLTTGDGAAPAGSYRVPEELNLSDPDRVLAIHRAYVTAGAEVIQTNSFGASSLRLAAAGLAAQAATLSRRAAELARTAAGTDVWVAGAMGPVGSFLEPLGDLTEAAASEAFGAQAAALAAGGADLLLVETMADPQEAAIAVAAARQRTQLPVVCTFAFDTQQRTLMGTTPEQAAKETLAAGADVVGVNCGDAPEFVIQAIQRMRDACPDALLAAQPNAGLPHVQNGTTVVYDVGPAALAAYAERFVAAGVRLVGSCCGSTPAYTAALGATLRDQT